MGPEEGVAVSEVVSRPGMSVEELMGLTGSLAENQPRELGLGDVGEER